MSDAGDGGAVEFRLPDGTIREKHLSTTELAELEKDSDDITPTWHKVVERVLKPATFLLAAFVSALLIPAITQQWTDRQKDIEIKSALIKQMAESATVAVNNVRFLGSGGNPEAHVRNTLCSTTDPTAPGPGSEECKKARRDATFATAKITTETRVDWRRASASARGQLIAYFSGMSVRWAEYSDNLERFLEIFTSCSDASVARVNALITYLQKDMKHKADDTFWTALRFLPNERRCLDFGVRARNPDYADAIDELTDALAVRRNRLMEEIAAADTKGLSTTRRDLLHDSWWVFAGIALIALIYVGVVIALARPPGRGS